MMKLPTFFPGRIGVACLALILSILPTQANDRVEVDPMRDYLFECRLNGFSQADYQAAVNLTLAQFEHFAGRELKPGEKGKVGLKVFTSSGPGLSTPLPLVRSVINALVERGYAREDIIIVDMFERRLREAGFLPRLSQGGHDFEGSPVVALEGGEHYVPEWFYDSPLPSREVGSPARHFDVGDYQPDPEERKSFLPVPLFLGVDFWINLPMVADNQAFGLSGAIANATLWNISNSNRFLESPANAPVAMAEIAAIPELTETWLLTMLTLEHYQFMGGPRYNAGYSRGEPALWTSANPVILDFLMWRRINAWRERLSLPLIEPEPLFLEYCRSLGLGEYDPSRLKLVPLHP
jgi:hypothetical protein